jgi:hypothetical protein
VSILSALLTSEYARSEVVGANGSLDPGSGSTTRTVLDMLLTLVTFAVPAVVMVVQVGAHEVVALAVRSLLHTAVLAAAVRAAVERVPRACAIRVPCPLCAPHDGATSPLTPLHAHIHSCPSTPLLVRSPSLPSAPIHSPPPPPPTLLTVLPFVLNPISFL